jgi:hypothetical protein
MTTDSGRARRWWTLVTAALLAAILCEAAFAGVMLSSVG